MKVFHIALVYCDSLLAAAIATYCCRLISLLLFAISMDLPAV
jgi:hypothetical protein